MGTPRRHISRRYLVVNWLLFGVLLLGGSAKVGYALAGNAAAQQDKFPVSAVDSLEGSHIPGTMYNLYHWGGYLIWRLYPDHKVFIDGRADVYGDAFIDEYLRVYQLREDWRAPLDRYGVNFVIIDKGCTLSTVLNESPDWDRVHVDQKAAIFVKHDEDES